MARTYKILGQDVTNGDGSTMTTLYTVPASTQAVISSVVIGGGTGGAGAGSTARLVVKPTSATSLGQKHYLCYDINVPAKDTVTLTLGITLDALAVVQAASNNTTISFNVFGAEIS
jgi:hypothetical protein